jgi:predicted O-methyltransferase YrrM
MGKNNEIQGAAASFITNLTGANTTEIQKYTAEIRADRKFRDSIEEKRSAYGRKLRSNWEYGIGKTLGEILYVICRRQKPDSIMETGVASGVSSSHILCALEINEHGKLYSIDLPTWEKSQSGWMIPDYLRYRWHFTQGRSSETMEPLLKNVKEIDIFLHDSDHTYENMRREFETAWIYLKAGGLLLSHNIDYSDAFPDFCRDHGVEGLTLGDMGGILKA